MASSSASSSCSSSSSSTTTITTSFSKNSISILMQIPKNLPISLHFTPSKISRALIFSLLLLLSSLFFFSSSSSLSTTLPSISASNLSSRFLSTSSSSDSLNTQLVSNGSAALSAIHKPHLQDSRKPLDSEVNDLNSCDIFNGNWVLEDSDPIYKPGSCPFIDESFNCFKNGRPDSDYLKLRWKPYGCEIPRFDGKRMLEMLRGKRVVFVGDSLNRNMWESFVCALREALVNKNGVFEVSGRTEFKSQGFYSFIFREHNCSIDFFKSPFLVQEWKAMARGGGTQEERETLRLDMIQGSSSKYCDADIVIFNTGHWWTHQKITKGNFFQEGNHVYGRLEVAEAYTKALRTWAQWVDTNVDPSRTRVFFRGYSASHFKGGQWNSGGNCDGETQPITNETYLSPYPWMMSILENVISEMKIPVLYLNITKMTDYRKDGHPSIYRIAGNQRNPGIYQDCSHWCLPGVPDSWNELLYATLLMSHQ